MAAKKPTVPANIKQPSDRKAKAEARSEDLLIEHNGRTYTIPREAADNVEILELIEDEKYISSIRAYIGAQQWAEWKDANRNEIGAIPKEAFEEFLDAAMEQIGGAGNSEASSTS